MNTEVEDLLRQAMERLTERVPAPAGLAAKADRGRRRGQLRARGAMAGAAAAITAASVAVTVAGPGPHADSLAGARPQARTAAYVIRAIEGALGAADNKIMFLSTHVNPRAYGGQRPLIDFWSYRHLTSSAKGLGGHLFSETAGRGVHGRATGILVDFRDRTWWRGRLPDPHLASYPPNGCAGQPDDSPLPGDPAWAPYLRATLACGGYRVAGKAQVDGREALKIVSTAKNVEFRYAHETFFVSPATYLPIRILIPFGYQDIRWLPPTAANLAKLHVWIPAGFRQIKPPRG